PTTHARPPHTHAPLIRTPPSYETCGGFRTHAFEIHRKFGWGRDGGMGAGWGGWGGWGRWGMGGKGVLGRHRLGDRHHRAPTVDRGRGPLDDVGCPTSCAERAPPPTSPVPRPVAGADRVLVAVRRRSSRVRAVVRDGGGD